MRVIVNWLGISLTPGGAADTCRLESPSMASAAGKGKCQPPTLCCQGPTSLPTWETGSGKPEKSEALVFEGKIFVSLQFPQ